jgi:hypothetical protein
MTASKPTDQTHKIRGVFADTGRAVEVVWANMQDRLDSALQVLWYVERGDEDVSLSVLDEVAQRYSDPERAYGAFLSDRARAEELHSAAEAWHTAPAPQRRDAVARYARAADAERVEAMSEMLDTYRLRDIRVTDAGWDVDSKSGNTYEVRSVTRRDRTVGGVYFQWRCSCPARRRCRHIDAVEQLNWEEAAAEGDYDRMDMMERYE